MLNKLFFEQGQETLNIDSRLKATVAERVVSEYGTRAEIIERALNATGTSYSVLTDTSNNQTVISMLDIRDKPVIKISPNDVNIVGGHPQVTASGLSITLFPVTNFCPGDILQLDNAFVDTSSGTNDADSVLDNYNFNYLDDAGLYVIQEVHYSLENRGSQFCFTCKAIALSKFENITGVSLT